MLTQAGAQLAQSTAVLIERGKAEGWCNGRWRTLLLGLFADDS